MYGLQIMGILVCAVMVYITFLHLKKGRLPGKVAAAWLLVWIGAIGWLLSANFSRSIILEWLDVATLFEVTVGLGVLFAVVVVFFLSIKVEKIQKDISIIVKHLAVKEAIKNEVQTKRVR